MQTSAIRHRVVDFLQHHPPFQEMEEVDLLALVERGRVKFHECEEFVYWQKAVPGPFLFVIQQGTVSLLEENGGQEKLCDVRGEGDLLGIERFLGAEQHLYSARTNSDVILYALPAGDFKPLLQKYPGAARYVEAHASVSADYQVAGHREAATQVRVYDAAWTRCSVACGPEDTLQEAARRMAAVGAKAIAVLDGEQRVVGVLTSDDIVSGIGSGRLSAASVVLDGTRPACCVAPQDAVSEAILAMARAGMEFAAMTSDGTAAGRFEGMVSAGDLSGVFGSSPFDSLPRLASADGTPSLHYHHRRARQFLLEHATMASSMDWLAAWAGEFDRQLLRRLLTLSGDSAEGYCWCFTGAAGRGEKLTSELPGLALIVEDVAQRDEAAATYREVLRQLVECGYRRFEAAPDDPDFGCASLAEWKERFQGWVQNPILNSVYEARPYFDLTPVHGEGRLWEELARSVREEVQAEKSFVKILAHDCLNSFPPITFLQDYVVDESGAHRETFQLQRSALWPLVDVGRVLGMAAGQALGGSTQQRLAQAARRLPEHERIFREAAETLRVVLYQQTRSGIRTDSSGAELPPALVSRHDRQVLKSGFRSIVRLLEFMESGKWQEAL